MDIGYSVVLIMNEPSYCYIVFISSLEEPLIFLILRTQKTCFTNRHQKVSYCIKNTLYTWFQLNST